MANPVSWSLEQIKRINDAVWHTPLSELSMRKVLLIKQLRIIVLASRGFAKDKVQLRASALTFYTLLSIIPVIAIAFAIAKGFGLDQNLEAMIMNSKDFQSQQDVLRFLLNGARTAISETRGGYMAGIGVIILFWSVMSLLDNIENSFNHIWQIHTSRAWYRKFTDYLTIMLIAPVFLILSGSITVFVGTELTDFMSRAPILAFFKPVISFLIKLIPYFLTWTTLTILYIIMPNVKVNFVPAMVSGIVAGTLLQLLLWLYIDLQFGITKLSAIYGSFAAVPLLIIWLQSSWTLVLLGAELSFANQNVSRYELESEALKVSSFQKRALVLMTLHLIIKNFSIGEKAVSAEQIGKTLKIPVRLARDILQDLTDVNLVSIVHEKQEKENLYQPAIDINKVTVSFVLNKLDRKGSGHVLTVKGKEYGKVVAMLEKFEKLASKSDSNILIKDL
jgi:membrane protein